LNISYSRSSLTNSCQNSSAVVEPNFARPIGESEVGQTQHDKSGNGGDAHCVTIEGNSRFSEFNSGLKKASVASLLGVLGILRGLGRRLHVDDVDIYTYDGAFGSIYVNEAGARLPSPICFLFLQNSCRGSPTDHHGCCRAAR
jgi:hypothetical protein